MSDRWVWMTFAEDGNETPIGVFLEGRHTPLDLPTRQKAIELSFLALAHSAASGQEVWLRHFRSVRDYKPEDL